MQSVLDPQYPLIRRNLVVQEPILNRDRAPSHHVKSFGAKIFIESIHRLLMRPGFLEKDGRVLGQAITRSCAAQGESLTKFCAILQSYLDPRSKLY